MSLVKKVLDYIDPDGVEDKAEECKSYTSASILEAVRKVVEKPAKLHSPLIGEKELELVSSCIRNGQVTHGPHVEQFEGEIKTLTKAKSAGGLTPGASNAIAVSSGTAALHLSLLAAGVSRGDKIVVPSFTFVATANAVSYCGAIPQFVDCDEFGGLDPQKLDDWLSSHKVKAVICVHCFGTCCDMDGLVSVCNKYGVPLIEDAAQAIGSYYKSKHAGTFGLLGAFSFNGNKIITTGGGGCVVTDDPSLAKKVRSLASVAKEDVPNEFWHGEVGFNYRMPNINAALGCGQIENLYQIQSCKKVLSRRYEEALIGSPVARMMDTKRIKTTISGYRVRPGVMCEAVEVDESNHWLNAIILTDPTKRKETASALNDNGFECRLGWTPLHYLPMYKNCERGDLSVTERLAKSIINIPSGPGIIA